MTYLHITTLAGDIVLECDSYRILDKHGWLSVQSGSKFKTFSPGGVIMFDEVTKEQYDEYQEELVRVDSGIVYEEEEDDDEFGNLGR